MKKTKGFINEFKQFISKGNVINLAVGIIIGSAFTAIVTSLVNDIVMPLIGLIIGGVNFTNLKYIITPATTTSAESAIYYGKFMQSCINFILIAFVVFVFVKIISKLTTKEEEKKEEKPVIDEKLEVLKEIKDLLQK